MSTTELATTGDSPINALASLGFSGNEGPRVYKMILVQAINAAEVGAPAGTFVDTEMGPETARKKLSIIPLKIGLGRSFMPPKDQGMTGVKPICMSLDRIMPLVGKDLIRQDSGRGCAKCPKSVWQKINGKNVVECYENHLFTYMDIATGFVYRQLFKGYANPQLKDMRDKLSRFIQLSIARKNPIQLYNIQVDFTSVLMQTGVSKTFQPVMSLPTICQDTDIVAMARTAYEFVHRPYIAKSSEDGDAPFNAAQGVDNAIEAGIGLVEG